MPLPLMTCPNCRASASLDVFLTDDSVRAALDAVIDAHPAGDTLIKPMLRYIGLFAPTQSRMAYSRIAALTRELTPAMRDAQISRNGRIWPAPQAYWQSAFQTVIDAAHAGKLSLPLKSHGYLFEVIARMSHRQEAQIEARREAQRAGHAGMGTPDARAQTPVAAHEPSRNMPPNVRQTLHALREGMRRASLPH